ncbi:MAG: TatD family hydrolase [Pseudomonadota bacterium]
MIDIGVNLLHSQFDPDRDAVMARARAAGMEHMVLTGTDLPASARAAELAATDPAFLSATAGIHPHASGSAPADWQQTIEQLAQAPAVRAIGETGLDFNRNFSDPADQERVFRAHLALAARLGLPVFVHEREAGAAVAGCLTEAPELADVVVHCFTGSRDDLTRFLDLGCYIGITGWVCDRRRGGPLRELVPHVPLDRLMVETDAPFLRPHNAPADAHGRRNEPALLPWVIDQLAELYGMPSAELAATTAANARAFFRLDG